MSRKIKDIPISPLLENATNNNVGDLISRQQAIRWVKTECNPYGKPTLDFESGKKVIEHLEQMSPAHPEPHWIPVTEEPKKSGKYLVTAIISFIPDHIDDPCTYEAVTTANYSADTRDHIKWWGNNVEKVLAWMPLPEPYKGVTE